MDCEGEKQNVSPPFNNGKSPNDTEEICMVCCDTMLGKVIEWDGPDARFARGVSGAINLLLKRSVGNRPHDVLCRCDGETITKESDDREPRIGCLACGLWFSPVLFRYGTPGARHNESLWTNFYETNKSESGYDWESWIASNIRNGVWS